MISEDDKKTIEELDRNLRSILSDIDLLQRSEKKLETIRAMIENGAYEVSIDITGECAKGSYSCDRPRLKESYGESTGIPKDVLESMLKFYKTRVDFLTRKLTSVLVMRTDRF